MSHKNVLNTNYLISGTPASQPMMNGQYNNPNTHNLTPQLNMTNNFQGNASLGMTNNHLNNCGFNNNSYQFQQNQNINNNSGINNISNNNSQQIYDELLKLNPSEQQKLLQILREKKTVQNTNSCDFIEEEKYHENEEIEEDKLLKQKLLNKRLLNQQLDYKDCWDFYFSAIATIENIALGKSSKKEYGNWDEFDACSFKNKNDLIIQLLKIIKNFKGAYEDYINDYEGIIDYPEDINITINKMQKWKKIINDKDISNYIDELIDIINNKEGKLDIQKELNKFYVKNKIDKKEMRQGFESVMKCSKDVRQEEGKLIKEFEEKGKLNYEVKMNVPAGRLTRKNKKKENDN